MKTHLEKVERAHAMWQRIRTNPQFKPEFVADTDAWLRMKLLEARARCAAADAIAKAAGKVSS